MLVDGQFERRSTRKIVLRHPTHPVEVGGDAPISVQSMTITKTADVEGTLAQIYALHAAGADIVRCTCNEIEAAEGLAHIVPRSPVPVVADIHHQYKMALAALDAGVHCLRLNPGNIRRPEHIKLVAQECKDRGVPIRIGVNGGSLDPELYKKHGGRVTPEAMVESAQIELAYFDEIGFDDVKISVKASSVPLMIEAYRQLSEVTDHPLHLGVTEAGPPPVGVVKATAGIATLLAEGIGDTIRYSLTADPVEEARAGRQLLEAMGLRRTQERRPHRVPVVRAGRDRRHQGRRGGDARLRRPRDPTAGGGHGLRRQRPGRGTRTPTSESRPATSEAICSSAARTSRSYPRRTWSTPSSNGPSSSTSTASSERCRRPTSPRPRPRRRKTATRCSKSRVTTPTPASNAST